MTGGARPLAAGGAGVRAGRGLRHPDRPAAGACPPGRDRAAGHLAGHRAGHLGGHGHGRVGRVAEQLLAAVRPARGRDRWSLATPEGVADNGGLVAAGDAGGASLVVGFRPSQALAFSPLATSSNTGQTWTPGLLDAALADVPDALAVAPSGQWMALLSDGSISSAPTAGAAAAGHWSRLSTLSALAATTPGRGCGLVAVNAVSFGPDSVPMAAEAACGGVWPGSSLRPAAAGRRRGRRCPPGSARIRCRCWGWPPCRAAIRRCWRPGPTCWRPGRTGGAGRCPRRSEWAG